MADTSVQHEAEAWVVANGLSALFPGVVFAGKKMKLIWGGTFAFDAVSEDGSIVAAICPKRTCNSTMRNRSMPNPFHASAASALSIAQSDIAPSEISCTNYSWFTRAPCESTKPYSLATMIF